MSKNNPETPPQIQMTPVEFSPSPTADAIGSVGGFRPLQEMHFPLSVPVAILLLTLVYSTVRDIAGFNRRLAEIDRQDAPAVEMLKKASKQTEFIESIRTSLQQISPTDPVAAQVLADFFPPEKKPNQDGAAPSPSK